MRIIIVGCGKIGRTIIDSMVGEKHDILAIDNKLDVIQDIANTYDVMAVCGNATSREMLAQANVQKADLFIAVTESDEVNMLSCFLAKRMGAKYTVARIRETEYADDGVDYLVKQLDLSMALNPEMLAAETLFDILKLPSPINVETFAGKTFQLLEMTIKESSPLANETLANLRKKCPVQFVACVVQRGENVYIPNGTFVLEEGDKVAFMVKRTDSHKFLKSIGMVKKRGRNVILLGGSTIAYYLAKMLSSNGYDVTIIERDMARCQEIAEKLANRANIIHGDGMQQDLLLEQGIQSTDAFVALTGNDEENILVSFYAMNQQVPQVVAKVSHNELASLAEKLGLDCIVSPRKIVADALTSYARALKNSIKSKMETMYSLMDDKAEALEFVALPDCSLVNRKLKDLKLKPNIVIAGITRGKESIIPTGDDTVLAGDSVIVIATDAHLYDLSDAER